MKKKDLISLFLLLFIITLSPITASASNNISSNHVICSSSEIEPRGNVTGYIYKIYNGRQWKRLWSYTYNRWEEPKWTLVK